MPPKTKQSSPPAPDAPAEPAPLTCPSCGQTFLPKAFVPLPPEPPSYGTSDEGVPFEWRDPQTIVNIAADRWEARRVRLHVAGRMFAHVAEEGGTWVYRHD